MNEDSDYNYDEFNIDDDYNNFNEWENSHYSSNSLNNYKNCLNKFKVYFYFKINKDNEFVYPMETDFLNIKNQYGYDMINNIIKKINEKKIVININSSNYILSLKDSEEEKNNDFYINNYELRPCNKKDLKPKKDIPSYSSKSLLKDFVNERISFISKYDINIMLMEKYDDYEKNENVEVLNIKKTKEKKSKKNIINKKKGKEIIEEKRKCINYCLII